MKKQETKKKKKNCPSHDCVHSNQRCQAHKYSTMPINHYYVREKYFIMKLHNHKKVTHNSFFYQPN
jgi:hypothetical protein